MNSADPNRPSINPRQLLRQQGSIGLSRLLATTGYMVQKQLLSDAEQAILSCMPLLVEGPRGGGKTAMAEALSEACNLPLCYLQGMEDLNLDDVLFSWDKAGQAAFVANALKSGIPLREAMAAQWTEDYLVLGEVLAAYELASRTGVVPILVVDEADKLKPKIEDMLLQVFARGYASIPRFGDIGVKNDPERWPIVILLSNDIRHDLSAPTRSRCIYSWLDLPTPAESVAILSSRVPEAPASAVATVARILDCVIDIQGVVDKPALREGISLLGALVRDGVDVVDEAVLDKYLCHLAKRHNDRDYLRLSLGRLAYAANTSNPELDVLVDDYFAARARSKMRVAA